MNEGRLAAPWRYGILDTQWEEAFDRLTGLDTNLFGVEIAFVAFLDTDRQWLGSEVGFSEKEADLTGTFCTRTIQKRRLLDIEDANKEEPDEEE